MPSINIGRVRQRWRGEWNNSTVYEILDAVSYQGSSYGCYVASPAGVTPTDGSKWTLLASKGDSGQPGPVGPIGETGVFDETFESVSANLKSYNPTYVYAAGKLDTVTYDLGAGQSIVKTFSYSGGKISTITLSGDTPNGINLVKAFTFTAGSLTSVTYS